MKNVLQYLGLAALALVAASPVAAQGINGKWITEFDRVVRNDDGAVSTGDKARARLTLEQKGDSVIGTWELLAAGENRAPVPRQLRGIIKGDKVTLASQFDATVNLNGEQSTRKIEIVYDFTVSGDTLEGTMIQRSSSMEMPARPFSAWRDKA